MVKVWAVELFVWYMVKGIDSNHFKTQIHNGINIFKMVHIWSCCVYMYEYVTFTATKLLC